MAASTKKVVGAEGTCPACGAKAAVHRRREAKMITWTERIPCHCGRTLHAWKRTHSETRIYERTFGLDRDGYMDELTREIVKRWRNTQHEEELVGCMNCKVRLPAKAIQSEPDAVEIKIDMDSLLLECRACGHAAPDLLFKRYFQQRAKA